MQIFIEYLNKSKNFQIDREYFNDFEQAKIWGKENLENFNIDMIKTNHN